MTEESKVRTFQIPYISKKKNPNFVFNFDYASPQFVYQYDESTNVQCSFCNANFQVSQLIDNLDQLYDGSWCGSTETCPKCREPNCCKLEYMK